MSEHYVVGFREGDERLVIGLLPSSKAFECCKCGHNVMLTKATQEAMRDVDAVAMCFECCQEIETFDVDKALSKARPGQISELLQTWWGLGNESVPDGN